MPKSKTSTDLKESSAIHHTVGKLEGRLDGFEYRFNQFENRVEKKLNDIENTLKDLTKIFTKGMAVKQFLIGAVGFIVVIPPLVELWKILTSLGSP